MLFMKRGLNNVGQVSAFVFIALIVVGTVIGYFVFNSGFNSVKVDSKIDPVYNHVDNCLGEVGGDAIKYVSLRGGYYELRGDNELGISYYVVDGKANIPSLEEVENQISFYVEDFLSDCLSFEKFEGFEINEGDMDAETKINEDRVNFDLNYLLSIERDNESFLVENFEKEIEVRLGLVYETTKDIVLNELEDLEFVCLSCLQALAETRDLKVNVLNLIDSTIYTIRDENSKINDEVLAFNFAIKI